MSKYMIVYDDVQEKNDILGISSYINPTLTFPLNGL